MSGPEGPSSTQRAPDSSAQTGPSSSMRTRFGMSSLCLCLRLEAFSPNACYMCSWLQSEMAGVLSERLHLASLSEVLTFAGMALKYFQAASATCF